MRRSHKPKLAVWKFASCDGCQLSLLDCEDELLAIAGAVEMAYFMEASSNVGKGPYDVSLVEGSITTAHDAERIQEVRKRSKKLVSIGACATAGGIQALRNFGDVDAYTRAVYAHPEYIATLATSTPIAQHVRVDFELRGCPVNKYQLLELLTALIHGRTPKLPHHAVCLDCKRRGIVCVMVAHGTPCSRPRDPHGFGALCPFYARGLLRLLRPGRETQMRQRSRLPCCATAPASATLGCCTPASTPRPSPPKPSTRQRPKAVR